MQELSLHILDVAENSLQAGATRIHISVEEDLNADRLTLAVSDNGKGMTEAQLARITDPFFTTRTTRHVGLGVPFLKEAAQACNGSLAVTSQPGVGTRLEAVFQHSHIDRAPLGDMASTLLAIVLSTVRTGPGDAGPLPTCDLHYVHRLSGPAGNGERVFEFDTADIRAALEGAELSHPAVRSWLRQYIAQGEAALRAATSVEH